MPDALNPKISPTCTSPFLKIMATIIRYILIIAFNKKFVILQNVSQITPPLRKYLFIEKMMYQYKVLMKMLWYIFRKFSKISVFAST